MAQMEKNRTTLLLWYQRHYVAPQNTFRIGGKMVHLFRTVILIKTNTTDNAR